MIKKWGGAFIVLVLAMGACYGGVRDVREAVANRAPTELTCPEFLSRRPADTWVHLRGAAGTLQDSAFRTENGVVDRVYVPLTCEGSAADSIRMVLATEDPGLISAVKANQDVDVRRDITGMARTSKDHETGTTTGGGLEGGCANCSVKLAGLAADYMVIEEYSHPSLLRGLAWLVAAIVGCGFIWKLVRS
jgi:hypothetical protein